MRTRNDLLLEGVRRGRSILHARPKCRQRTMCYLFVMAPLCVALNRSRGRRQEGIEPLPDDGIALARRLFETGTIENCNSPPIIADETGRLQRLRC